MSKGPVNITDLPAREYRVTVYDEMEESSMEDLVAFKHSESLQIRKSHNPHPMSTLSVSSVQQTGTISVVLLHITAVLSMVTLVPVSG